MTAPPSPFVIPGGQEACVSQMLRGDDPLPGGYVWAGASIDRTLIRARFESELHEPIVLLLEHLSAVTQPQQTTSKFALSIEGKRDDSFLQAITQRIRKNEQHFVWQQPTNLSSRSAPPETLAERAFAQVKIPFAHGREVAFGLSALIVLFALMTRLRVHHRPHQPEPNPQHSPISARASVVMFVAGFVLVAARVGLELRHFLLDSDDFDYLLRAAVDPWRPDEGLRFLSTSVLFRVGTLLGAKPWFFMVASTMAFASMLGGYGVFLRRLGYSRHNTWMAITFWGLSPAPMYLLSWGAGLQQLLGMALLFSSLSAAIDALRAEDRHTLVSATSMAMAVASVGVFVKFPLMLLVPPSILLCSWIVIESKPTLRRSILCAAMVASSIAVPLFLAHPASNIGEVDKVGIGRLSANVAEAFSTGVTSAVALVYAIAIVVVARIMFSRRQETHAEERPLTLRQTIAYLIRAVVSLRIGRTHSILFCLLAACIWVMPFLMNRRYFAGYYLSLPLAALAAYAAQICGVLLPKRHTAAVATIAMLAAFPLRVFDTDMNQSQRQRVAEWLTTVVNGLHHQPAVDRIVLAADCNGDGNAEKDMAEDLRAFVEQMSGESAIRWATRRHDVSVVLANDATRARGLSLLVHSCRNFPLRIEIKD